MTALNSESATGTPTINILAGEPNSYTLGGGSLAPTDQIIANSGNFGSGGTYDKAISVVGPSSTIDSAYLAQGSVFFDGFVPDGSLTAGELSELDTWVQSGGILISTNDSASYDNVSSFYGLTIGGSASSGWLVEDPAHPIMDGPFGQVGNFHDSFAASGTISYFDSASLQVGDIVVATDSGTGEPTMVVRQHGQGYILFTSDEGIFRANMTGGGTVTTANDILAANVFAWAAEQSSENQSYSMTIDVTPVNDAPTSANNTVVTIEDSAHVFSASDFSFSDIEGDALASVQITSLESVGSLQLNGVDVTLNQVISRADIDAGLLTFSPVANQNGSSYDSFGFTVNDGTDDSASSYSMTVDVAAVNDAPTAASNVVVTNEDFDHIFSVGDFAFSDVDGDSLVSVQITSLESVGSLQLNGVDVVLNQMISRADIDAGLLTFSPVADENGASYDSFAFTVNDGTVDSTSSYTMSVDVTAVNDAPTAASNTVVTNEDVPHVFSVADFAFSDIDGDSLVSVQITSLESVGSLRLNGVDVTLNQVISRVDIDAGLLTFAAVANENGIGYDSFEYTVNDGTVDSASSYSMTVDVTAVNDAPTAANNTVVTNEDTPHVFSIGDFGFSDIEGDSLASVRITSLESVGSLQLNGVDVSLNQVISRADIDAGLLTFAPVADANGSGYDSFEFTVNDGTVDSSSSYTLSVDVTAINDAPTASKNTVVTNEDTDHVFAVGDFVFSDIDGDSLASVQITSLESVGSLQLNGVDVLLNQVISRADIDAGLLTFAPVANDNGIGYDSFEFTVNDGTVDSSSSYTLSVDVTAVNDAPTASNNTVVTNEDTDHVFAVGDFVFSDIDGDSLASVQITSLESVGSLQLNGVDVSLNQVISRADIDAGLLTFAPVADANGSGHDSFGFTVNDGTVDSSSAYTMSVDVTSVNDAPTAAVNTVVTNEDTAYTFKATDFNFADIDGDSLASVQITSLESAGSLQLNGVDVTLNQVISKADIDGGLLVFMPVADANGTGYDSFDFTVNDGTVDSASSYTLTVDVTAVNDAPTAANNTVVTNEDVPHVFSVGDFAFSDIDGDSLVSVQITSLESVGSLQLNGVDVTLNQVISRADIDAGLLTFAPLANDNGIGYDSFEFTVNDGTVDSASSYTLTVDVTAVNDAPTAANNTVVTNEDVPHVFSVGDFGFSDIDGDSLASVQITSLESVGSLQLNGVDVALNQVISRADIDAGLLTFAPVANDNGTGYDSFEFTINDGTVNSTSSYSMTIDVAAVNDAPTAVSNTVLTNEDVSHVFSVGDFGFGDIDGDSLASVQITSLESVGSLQLNGVDVALNQVVSRGDIDAGLLTFAPAANDNGNGYDSFEFTVNDGTVDSTSTYSITVDVAAVNDAPTASDNTVFTNENSVLTFSASDFSFGDIDGDSLASVQITTLESVGSLELNGVDVTLNQVISLADIDAGLLTFTPEANENGTGYDSFGFTVNDGNLDSASSHTMTIDVGSVDYAPTAVNSTVNTNEDTVHVFGVTDFNFSDTDGDPLASVQITALESVGSLQLNGVDVVLNQVISRADIDSGLLTFTPVSDQNGAAYDSFDFTVNDGTFDSTSSYTMSIDVTAVNDAPTAANNTIVTLEDSPVTFSASDFVFGDVDGDSLAFIEITSLESTGALQLNGVDVVLNQVVSRADIDAGLLTFVPVADENGSGYDSFAFSVNDGTEDSVDSYSMTIDVVAVNDTPTAANSTIVTNEDVDYTFAVGDFAFSDVDGDSFASIQITSLESVGSLQLNGVDVLLNQVISRADIDAGLLTFTPVADGNGSGYDSFEFTVNDGTIDSLSSYTMTVDVNQVNDAPTAASNTVVTNEDVPHVFNASDFVFSDIDGDALASIQVTSLESVGSFQLNGVDVTLNQVISRADIDAGLLTFTALSNDNGAGYDGFGFTVNDGTVDSAFSYTMTVDVTAVNDAPTAANNSVSTLEDTPLTFTSSDFGYGDVEGDLPVSIHVTALETAGSLKLAGAEVLLNQVINWADIDAGLLTFEPAANENGLGYDSFDFTVNDGAVDSTSSYTMTIDVTAVNDEPIQTVPVSFAVVEEVATSLSGISVADVDSTGNLSTRLQVNNGTLNVSLVGSTSIVAGFNGSGDLTIEGTEADINATLASLTYTGNPNVYGTNADSLTVTTSDLGNFGVGGVLTDVDNVQIDITAIQDPPTTSDTTLTINEDEVYSLRVSDFPFADVDGDSFQEIKITNLPSGGALKLNGVSVMSGDVILVTDIAAGNLTFTPAPDAFGNALDGFGFRVGDGIDFSEPTSTVSLLDSSFDADAEGFVYSDDVFGTSQPGNALGRYESARGFDGGGLFVRVGGSGGVASSGGWTQTINVAEDGIATVSLMFNLNVSNRLDAGEYGEAILEIDGVKYGTGLNNSLAHYEGGGVSGWQQATFEVELSAGSHTLTLGAFTNSTNANNERVRAYFDDVSVDLNVYNQVEFDVLPVNDASEINGIESSPLNYVEDTGPVAVSSSLTLNDVDDSHIESAVVRISGNYVTGEDVLSFADTANISSSWDVTTGTLTLTGSDSVANYQAALRAVAYENLSDDPSTTTRTVSFTVNDGDENSLTESRAVDIVAVNDSSVIFGLETSALNYVENTGLVPVSSSISIGDVDDAFLNSAQVHIAGNYQLGEDVLRFSDTSRITGNWDAANGILTLTGVDSVASYEAALRSIFYENVSEDPSTAVRTIAFKVNDGDDDSNSQFRNVTVTRVNDVPVVGGSDTSDLTYTENSTVDLFPSTTLLDYDDNFIESAVVQITGNFVAGEDVLGFVNTPQITGTFDSVTGALTLTGTGTVANYEAAIRSVTYTNTSENPSILNRMVELKVNDGDDDSVSVSRTVNIVPVNDAPVVNLDGPFVQDESASFNLNLPANDFDPEGDSFQLTEVNGVSLTPGGSAVAVVGGFIELQPDGLTLTFTPTRNFFGNADFSYTVEDVHGATNSGTVQLDIVDITAPDEPVSVRLVEDANNDGFINIAENQGAIDYTVALPVNAIVGETLQVNGISHVLTVGDVAAGQVSGTLPAAVHNASVLLSVRLTDPAGNASTIIADVAVVDLVAPLTSAPLNLVAASDTGVSTTDNYTGDLNPNFRLPAGTGTAGDIVTIYSDGTAVGSGYVDSDGSALVSAAVSDFTVQKFTYTFTDSAGNESEQSIGLFVEFFDDALPYQPPSDPSILGVEQIVVEDPDPVISPFDLQFSEDDEEEREKIPFLRDLVRNSSLVVGNETQARSIRTDEIDVTNFVINSSLHYEGEYDGQKLIGFNGDLNYRVVSTGLDDLSSYDYQMETFLSRLTELADENREEYSDYSLLAGTASASAGVVIAGYALWVVRAAFIASWFATSFPAFTGFDPLTVLDRSKRDKETLAEIAEGKSD